MASFSWDDLPFFLAVARSGQLSSAARRLRSNHVTVSRRIDRLEQALGLRLFERSRNGYTLTVQGERLMRHVEAMAREAEHLGEATAGAKSSPRGVVRLATPEGFGNFFLNERLARFAREHPALWIEFVPIQQIVSLSRREADVAVELHPLRSGPYRQERITDYRLFLYASRDYLAANGPISSRAEIKRHPVVGYIDDMIFTPGLDYLRDFLPGVRAQYQSSSIHAQLAAGQAGYGLCVLPDYIAVRAPELVPILPNQMFIDRAYWLICHDNLVDAPRIRVVMDFLRREAEAASDSFLGTRLLAGDGNEA